MTTGCGKPKGAPVMVTPLYLQTRSTLGLCVRPLTLLPEDWPDQYVSPLSNHLGEDYRSATGHRSSHTEDKGQSVVHIYMWFSHIRSCYHLWYKQLCSAFRSFQPLCFLLRPHSKTSLRYNLQNQTVVIFVLWTANLCRSTVCVFVCEKDRGGKKDAHN